MENENLAGPIKLLGAAIKLYHQDLNSYLAGWGQRSETYYDLIGSQAMLRRLVIDLAGMTEEDLGIIADRMKAGIPNSKSK